MEYMSAVRCLLSVDCSVMRVHVFASVCFCMPISFLSVRLDHPPPSSQLCGFTINAHFGESK
jgi:hypothetical protein